MYKCTLSSVSSPVRQSLCRLFEFGAQWRTRGGMLRLTSFLLAGLLSVTALAQTAIGEEPTPEQWGAILNLSGRQRMLTQKMTKETLLVVAQVEPAANREALANTAALFESTLTALRDGDADLNLPATTNKRIVAQLDKVRTLYEELQPTFSACAGGQTPSKQDLQNLAEKNTILLAEMNKAVKMYERLSKKTLQGDKATAVVINLAGKQRMLTQKLTKECLLVHLNIDAEENVLNVRGTSTLFDATLKGLLDGDTNLDLPGTQDPAIRAQLQVVADLWAEFHPVVNKTSQEDGLAEGDLKKLADGNLPLLKNMNAAVKLFEKQTH